MNFVSFEPVFLCKIYVAMSNYTREVVRENAVALVPVMRPLFLMYEEDPRSYTP